MLNLPTREGEDRKKLTTESRVHKMKPSEMIMQCASGFIAMGKSIEEKQNFLNAACTA